MAVGCTKVQIRRHNDCVGAGRYRYQTLTLMALALYAIGLASLPLVGRQWQLWCVAVPLGAAGGMIIVIFFSIWSDLFGQRHLGRIQGAAQMITVIASGLGPVLFAKCAATFHSYAPLLLRLAGAVLALGLVARTILPQKTESTNRSNL